jgi:hypothetical protein
MNELTLESLAQRVKAIEKAMNLTGKAAEPPRMQATSEGESLEIPKIATPVERLTDEEAARRIESAKSLEEAFEILRAAPPWSDDYDILKALEDNRRWSAGFPTLPEASENR